MKTSILSANLAYVFLALLLSAVFLFTSYPFTYEQAITRGFFDVIDYMVVANAPDLASIHEFSLTHAMLRLERWPLHFFMGRLSPLFGINVWEIGRVCVLLFLFLMVIFCFVEKNNLRKGFTILVLGLIGIDLSKFLGYRVFTPFSRGYLTMHTLGIFFSLNQNPQWLDLIDFLGRYGLMLMTLSPMLLLINVSNQVRWVGLFIALIFFESLLPNFSILHDTSHSRYVFVFMVLCSGLISICIFLRIKILGRVNV